jgi:FAD/FMN-containing dehydrogenase
MDKKSELVSIVGQENVLDDPAILQAYAGDRSFAPARKPNWVVRPRNTNDVQALVKWANTSKTPLVPVSSGPPHTHGDTVPAAPGAVIVDLTGMNKIIRIDRRNRMMVIEPGVTYSQLLPELAKKGLRLCTPLLPRPNKSVVADLLERQPTIITRFQWSLLDPLRCIEVVFGDGEKIMTGDAGSHANTLLEEWDLGFAQQSPSGPGQIDFYRLVSAAQGSMGIVTWASIKCQVLPEVRKLFFVPARKLEDLLDFSYKVLRFRFGDEFLILNSTNLAAILNNTPEKIRALQSKLPPWVVVIGVSGGSVLPEERAAFQEKDIRDMAQRSGLELLPAVPGANQAEISAALGSPSAEPYWKLGLKGGCQDLFFITTLDRTPSFTDSMYSLLAEQNFSAANTGVYIQPVHQGSSCHCEFDLFFDPADESEAAEMKRIYTLASEKLINQGAFFSRPYGIWADMAFNRDAQTTMALKKVKAIFDPNNVMNPGKLCF